MAEQHDAIVVGAGLNGLAAAFYLARSGRKVLVLERREIAGGRAVTEEFHPGFRCSTVSHTIGPMLRQVAVDMRLNQHDLTWLEPEARVCALAPDAPALVLHTEPARSAGAIAGFSAKDSKRFPQFHEVVQRISAVLAGLMTQPAPEIEPNGAGDLLEGLKAARAIRKLGKENMYRLLRWLPMAVADLVAEWFDTELLRATVAARGIYGNALGPWSAGSGAIFLLAAAADGNVLAPASVPAGGLGSLADAMTKAAREAGVEIRTGCEVSSIVVRDGNAQGIVTADGSQLTAKVVISNADPKRTLLHLVDPVHLDPSFVAKMKNYRCAGTIARVNFALSSLPSFAGLDGSAGSALSGRIHIGHEIDYLERAFDHSKYGGISERPYLDIAIPSLVDRTLAPAGQHVMSVHMQFAPFRLAQGNWNERRDELCKIVVDTISEHAPNFSDLVLGCQVITPQELEQTYGFTGGHIFHGELALDQLFSMRPLLGWARHRTPIRGLYLCGAGTHPGMGFAGASGVNASRAVLKDLR